MDTYRTVRRVVLRDECGHPHNPVLLAGKILDAAIDLYEQQTGEVPHPGYTSFHGIARDLERMGYSGYLSVFASSAFADTRRPRVSKKTPFGQLFFTLAVQDGRMVEVRVLSEQEINEPGHPYDPGANAWDSAMV